MDLKWRIVNTYLYTFLMNKSLSVLVLLASVLCQIFDLRFFFFREKINTICTCFVREVTINVKDWFVNLDKHFECFNFLYNLAASFPTHGENWIMYSILLLAASTHLLAAVNFLIFVSYFGTTILLWLSTEIEEFWNLKVCQLMILFSLSNHFNCLNSHAHSNHFKTFKKAFYWRAINFISLLGVQYTR